MAKLFATSFDYFAFNMYYTVGFFDMFLLPMSAIKFGSVYFIGIYVAVVLLYGVPAFTDECVYFMPENSKSRSPTAKRWRRGYKIIALIEITQVAIGEAHGKMMIAVTHFFSLLHNSHRTALLPLFAKNCDMNSPQTQQMNSSIDAMSKVIVVDSDTDVEKLQKRLLEPSCLIRNRSEMACVIHALFSDPGSILVYSGLMLTILILTYALIFGRSLPTYGAIGRFYIALVMLCIFTLLLHFGGRSMNSAPDDENSHIAQSFDQPVAYALAYSAHSLGLHAFINSVIGAHAGKAVKQNFVLLAISVCFADTAVAIAFTGLTHLRNAAVQHICSRSSSASSLVNMKSFMSLPDTTESMLNSSRLVFTESAMGGIVQMSESVMMFRETSGSVPWTVYLPFQALIMLFSVLLACFCFVPNDLLAVKMFKRRPWLVLALVVVRFGWVACINLFKLNGQLGYLENYMWLSVHLSFLFVKTIDCVTIHMDQGFSEFISDRRRLLPHKRKVQRFLYNWYIAPLSTFLYNLGYPVLLAVMILFYKHTVLTISYGVYFLCVHVLPVIIVMVTVYWG